jgi:hypothetical protein
MSKREQIAPRQEVSMARRRLVENGLVSDVCDAYRNHFAQGYHGQKHSFGNAELALELPSAAKKSRQALRIVAE